MATQCGTLCVRTVKSREALIDESGGRTATTAGRSERRAAKAYSPRRVHMDESGILNSVESVVRRGVER